jgi:N-formylglutamate deformylase
MAETLGSPNPSLFDFHPGTTPVLMSIPHTGTFIPDDLARRMSDIARITPDTDWHLDRLYDFAADLGLSILTAHYSRYVIDLNRSPDNLPLYPGAKNTELVPTTTFAEQLIYVDGAVPDDQEIAYRRETYWRPYHRTLERTLSDLRSQYGRAVLFDCHSIKSRVPRFFEGVLTDFNLGTADGASCDGTLRDRLDHVLRAARTYSVAVDGRFKGGYITRRYGNPVEGIHAFQLELSEATYMDEDPPFTFLPALADRVRPALRAMLEAALRWAETG